jgi:cytochrome c oxidase cbb3-type subunit I/II
VVLKFLVVAVTAYGMATFEGPMLSIKMVNKFAHFTDWIVAHVHVGALGWNGFLTFGILYWLIPRIFRTNLYSKKLANWHFWLGTLGILFYAIPMYWAGFTQSLMWQDFTDEGILKYNNFLETVTQIAPMYAARSLGGALYLAGVILMTYNIIKTVRQGSFLANEEAEAAPLVRTYAKHQGEHWHRGIERKPLTLMVVSLIVILIGGIIEMIPTFMVKSNVPTIASVKPYTPLELQGRDIYLREGCYTCHSQMVRPFRSETARYGEYSKAGEFVYDHPFQWGSKRTGPDLHRVGGKYSDSWHYNHMLDPSSMSPGSIMPTYSWLLDDDLDTASTPAKIEAMQTLGVPYPANYAARANRDLMVQADSIVASLGRDGIESERNKEIIALIAYLQRLGKDIKGNVKK